MSNRLEKLKARRTDNQVFNARMLNEVYNRINQSEAVKYVAGAMQPIDPEYTKNTYIQSERVCDQLKKKLSVTCEYEYQGSVTNDTHIKAKSDIDVLLLTNKFHGLENPQKPLIPYLGDPIQDLLDLRIDAINSLKLAFPQANVDTSSSKCITINGGSLTRDIDIVPSNWFHTNNYAETNNKIYRGVEILDATNRIRLKNTPFLHNFRVDNKDKQVLGGLRKAARLLKSLKYDSDDINISSYDLVSIAYNMGIGDLFINQGQELKLLQSCINFVNLLLNDENIRNSLMVPDGHRKIFAEGHATVSELKKLQRELLSLSQDVINENTRSFKKLEEARIIY